MISAQLIGAQAGAHIDREARLSQDLDSGFGQVVGNQNLDFGHRRHHSLANPARGAPVF